MPRPTAVLTCYLIRRRIGAYLDGALEEREAGRAAAHVSACGACQREMDALRRLRALLQGALVPAGGRAEPDWTGFWPGIVRRIEDARRTPAPRPARRAGWLRPSWAWSGALAAALLLSLTLWQLSPGPRVAEPPVVVSLANTDYPGGVMVYTAPEQQVTVVWVFSGD